MEQTLGGAFGGALIFVILFLIVLGILWFLLPFAIFGTKARLDLLITEVRATKHELRELNLALSRVASTTGATNTPRTAPTSSDSHDELMASYGISNDGENYIFKDRRFRDLRDAVTYARAVADLG